ncbi:meiotically up-regulated gene 113-domain-containing protein [Xylariomycetidae sp. FL2044]|nr:meiotically up-regulated gene 113-domain-containing protein [Xylariomycetidae sp. FL2044]
MPFIPNTPESLIARSDSKNPDTTCRGITASGRPCRRPLTASPAASPATSPLHPRRVSRLRVDDPSDPDLYCWQHKEQASSSARSSPGPRTRTTPILETRESFDELVGRLGIVEEEQRKGKRPVRNPARPSTAQPSGRMTQGANTVAAERRPPPPRPNPKPKKKELSFCCCFTIPIVEEERPTRPVRPAPRPVQSAPAKPASAKYPSSQHLAPGSAGPRPSVAASKHSSAHSAQSAMSQTSQFLSLIPANASPQTASQLLAELAKPISDQDEAGYIYIFWLTPESQSASPPADAVQSLLAPPRPDARQRRPSEVLQSYATKTSKSGSSRKTILLKIGRASNVQRRLQEWQRQCGYEPSLVRYFPYIPTSRPSTPRKMPHSHKVERLVHIELAGAGLRASDRGVCEACGRTHREWFEVDATREALTMVNEVIQRWSDWDEGR